MGEPLKTVYVPTHNLDNSKHYKSEKYDFQITDMGGGIEYLDTPQRPFGKLVLEHDVIIFVFDIHKYLSNSKYREDEVNPRLDFLWAKKATSLKTKVLLVVGSHLDDTHEEAITIRSKIEDALKNKPYRDLLVHYPLCLCDLTKKGHVAKVFETLNTELDKTHEK